MKALRKFLTLVLAGFLIQNSFADALDNWHWRNPLPNGNPQAGPHTLYGIIFVNGKFFGVGDSGVVSISSDATNWTEFATATTNRLNNVIFAAGKFLAIGNNGAIETSTDGTNWLLQVSGTTNSLSVAAYHSGKFVAAGANAVVTSSDTINWSSAVFGLSGATGLTSGTAGFVAVAGNTNVFFSANGSTWSSQALTAPGNSFGLNTLENSIVTYTNNTYFIASFRYATSMSADRFIFTSSDGVTWATNVLGNIFTGTFGFSYNFFLLGSNNVFAAGAANISPFLQFSSDGTNWFQTNNIPSSSEQGFAGAYGNGSYVIVAPANFAFALPPIFTSTDGLNWTNQQHAPTPPSGPTNLLTSITFSNGIYVVGSTNFIVQSTNGLVYSVVSNSPALSSVTFFNNNFVGVGSVGKIYQSGDGVSWTQRNSATLNNLHGIGSSSSLLVAVGDNGAIQTSPTGIIWTSRTSGTSLSLFGVAYSNGLFVAVGQLGTVLTSPDGINWSGQNSGQLTNLLSITFGSAGFAMVGPRGTILTSPDGINWTNQTSGTLSNLESVSFGNGYYLAAGDGDTVLTSPDGTTWTPRNVGLTGGQNLYGAAFLNGRFFVVGSNGTILESDPFPQLFALQIQRGIGQNFFTIFSAPGNSFRVQASTNLVNSVWTDLATFNNPSGITPWTNSTAGFNQRFYRAISP